MKGIEPLGQALRRDASNAELYELRDAAIPDFLIKVTPTDRQAFMVAYVANNGQRR
jgi:hypothetical protein